MDLSGRIEWSACTGFGFAVEGARGLTWQGNRPAGWEADDPTFVDTAIIHDLRLCERVSWGGFERGPVFTLIESHDDFAPPEACAGDNIRIVMQSIWFSDPELVRYAQEEFGMPARLGTFTYEFTANSPATHLMRWTWSADNGEPSEANIQLLDANSMGTRTQYVRFFWSNAEGGVSYLDAVQTFRASQLGPHSGYGRLSPPMLYGEAMQDDSFASADRAIENLDADYSAPISQFRDTQCAQPL